MFSMVRGWTSRLALVAAAAVVSLVAIVFARPGAPGTEVGAGSAGTGAERSVGDIIDAPSADSASSQAVGADDPRQVLASAEAGLEGHLLCFAAEKARVTGAVVDMDDYRREIDELADQAVQG